MNNGPGNTVIQRWVGFILLAGAIVSLCLLITYTYRVYHHPSPLGYGHCLGFLFSFAFFTATQRFSSEIKRNIALLFVTLITTLYLCEVTLRFLIRPAFRETRISIAREKGVFFDKRTKDQVIMDLRNDGIETYPNIIPLSFAAKNGIVNNRGKRYFPLGNVSNATTVNCNENGTYLVYKSDRYGFNNPAEKLGKKDVELLLVGDSFTEGACVKPEDNIAGWIRRTGREVVNLGNSGSGPLIELAGLIEYATHLKPKKLVWIYYEGNDLSDLQREKKSPMLLAYLNSDFSQDLVSRQQEVDELLKDYLKEEGKRRPSPLIAKTIYILKLKGLRNRIGITPARISPKKIPTFRSIMKKARNTVDSWGGELYFVYLPSWHRYFSNQKEPGVLYRDKVLSIINDLKIPLIDIYEEFEKQQDIRSLFPFSLPGGHYSQKGYKLVGEAISQKTE